MNGTSAFLSPLARTMPPSGIRQFFNAVNANPRVISLGVGEPDFRTPKHAREACMRMLEAESMTYTPNEGLMALREAIADYLYEGWRLAYEPSKEVLITVGGSEAIDLALRALITSGDEVLVPVPNYVVYTPIALLNGGTVVEIPLSASKSFKLTAEALRQAITPRSKVLVVNFPNNPTGAIMTYDDWLPIAKLIEEHNLIVLSDEIYAELTYEQKHVSLASLPGMKDRTIVISGFSKAFAMTGWRVGYACGHSDLIGAMTKIHQYTAICAPVIGQIAALECLRGCMEEKDRMIQSYDQRRRKFVQGLQDIGLPCKEPEGALYAFPSIAHTGMSSQQFAKKLLEEAEVAAIPGDVFGSGGEGHLRCCYAASSSQLAEALQRMDYFLRSQRI
ncbi:aminotransferase class I/II-fold pyridoxal phosphate-dependent enzyme [Paenibacillus terrigena]|uniref:pyridoxal phosphate-dependent aminotransferase n=1 Tax=Paenibacillus terrigena TaxID=369333 RepID=UPI0028D8246B|nr:aminotransferase class I/II-fold pyridoxal phosphate-dependent enzyme [Paenibacillus terrigena]